MITAWQEYPRPQLERADWTNLNGLWDYAVVGKEEPTPVKWDGQILVPFCPESSERFFLASGRSAQRST